MDRTACGFYSLIPFGLTNQTNQPDQPNHKPAPVAAARHAPLFWLSVLVLVLVGFGLLSISPLAAAGANNQNNFPPLRPSIRSFNLKFPLPPLSSPLPHSPHPSFFSTNGPSALFRIELSYTLFSPLHTQPNPSRGRVE